MKELLGGKGANLAEMSRLGIPVPPGFTISTQVCGEFQKRGSLSRAIKSDILTALTRVEQALGKRFGDPQNPLLVSVRSGARVSMPGMMDTVLNLGLNDVTVRGLAERAGGRFAYDSYRRFIQMYGDVVLGVPRELFDSCIAGVKEDQKTYFDTDLSAEDWQSVVRQFLELVESQTGRSFPQDPAEQLWGAVGAVFQSWGNERAQVYRRLHDYSDDWGTAVNVQAMVFGNMGDDCATGVVFTRDPSTGTNHLYGEYLKNAQGEDVVAGVRTPQPIDTANCRRSKRRCPPPIASWPGCASGSRSTTGKCRTSSSPSSRARCGCCRPGRVRERRPRPSRSPSISCASGSSPGKRLCCGSTPRLSTTCCIRCSTAASR
jgi:pyruvate,orthophosphate dikinase